MKSRLDSAERARTEPIAIVGLSCRFPGGADDADGYWRLLRDGVDAVAQVPRDRWDVDAYYDPQPDTPGKAYGRWGAFLDQVDRFDPQFFGIAPREAVGIDPQQRLLLEVTWEALEKAGIAPDRLSGTATGVFIGICSIDYTALQLQTFDLTRIDAYSLSGAAHSIAAGRLSYILGLQGPAVSVDTACSSSLVAVHLACQSLRNDECRMAVAAGVHVTLSPLNSVIFSRLRMLAADGRCKTFDAGGDGFVEGEGCGVIVLKRLSAALEDGDNVLALIRGSAVNQDGASSGLTAPNGPAQEAVIRAALQRGSVRPSEVQYVEAHGTGTSLGDPIEVQALAAVLGEGRSSTQPLLIGSVKTNIGHTQGAAGIAGLLKLVLALRHEEIPPSLHLNEPNPFIPWAKLPVRVATSPTPWRRGEQRRVGGVSSFGFSGTNVHVLVEEAPLDRREQADVDRPLHVVTLSARSDAALDELLRRWERHLAGDADLSLGDVGCTATAGRAHFRHRVSMVAGSMDELRAQMAAAANRTSAPGLRRSELPASAVPKIAFLFTGQGAQYAGMGRELYQTQPTFRRAIDRCAELLRGQLEQPLVSLLYPDGGAQSPIDRTGYAQPALFALEYALAELWKSWGVVPTAVLGHSVGEFAAACLAGVFSLDDAIALIAARGRLMQSLPPGGAMAAVFAAEARVRAAMERDGERLSVAAVNGPENTVVSGPAEAVTALLARLDEDGVASERLTVSHAFHSALMDPILPEFERVAGAVKYSAPRVTLISNLTGQPVRGEVAAPAYWRAQIREPVRFADGIAALYERGYRVFLEIGPRPTLSSMARRSLPADAIFLPSLRKEGADWRQILDSLAGLYMQGAELDWEGFDRDYGHRKLSLPTYPFERERYWIIPDAAGRSRPPARTLGASRRSHPLLGARLSSALDDIQFEAEISTEAPPFLNDHRKQGAVVFPATAYLEMGLAAAHEGLRSDDCVFEDLVITEPLLLDHAPVTLQTVLSPDTDGGASFRLFRLEAGPDDAHDEWRLHASARLRRVNESDGRLSDSLEAARTRCADAIPVDDYYARLLADGHEYGPAFRGMVALWRGEGEALGEIRLPENLSAEAANYRIHPALLDAAMQLLGAGLPSSHPATRGETYLPVSLGCCRVRTGGARSAWSHVRVRPSEGDNGFSADVRLYDDQGGLVAEVLDVYLRRASLDSTRRAGPDPAAAQLYEVAWRPAASTPETNGDGPDAVAAAVRGTWMVLCDEGGVGAGLAQRLEQQGASVVRVERGGSYEASAGHVRMDPGDPSQARRMLDDMHAAHGATPSGVVHLWGLDSREDHVSAPAADGGCGSLLHIVQALGTAADSPRPRLVVVTRGAVAIEDETRDTALAQAPIWGLARTIAAEHPDLTVTCIDVDPAPNSAAGGDARELDRLLNEIARVSADGQIAFRDGSRYVARLVRSRIPPAGGTARSQPVALETRARGLLENLELRPAARREPGPGEVEIRVAAAGLNFRDVLNALGMYQGEAGPLGSECVGTVVAVGPDVSHLRTGDVVLGMTAGGLRSYVTAPALACVAKPDRLTIEEAATVPVTFLTAEYALNRLARMQRGERVLIHAAAGGVGLAAVQLAQRAGAEIIATAGSPEKHAFLHGLGVQHVFSSRTLDFADEIRALTGGEGVDIVLNSLAGDFIGSSVGALRRGGRFLEIGKAGIWSHEEMAAVRPDVSYFPIYLGDVDPSLIQQMLVELMDQFASRQLKPLPSRTFPLADAVDAFRYMAQAKHIGKIVLEVDSEGDRHTGQAIRADATYLITGGLGALGLRVARHFVDLGARHLVLVGRNAPSSDAAESVRALEQGGASVSVAQADVSREADVTRLLADIDDRMPPLGGIVHAAGTVDDGVLAEQTWPRFEKVLAPKIAGAWHLHRLTERRPLQFFVMFSSMVSILGAPGQGNYAAANAFLDALAHYRRRRQLPALSIGWGPWDGPGMTARVGERDRRRWRQQGFGSIDPTDGAATFGRLLDATSVAHVAVLPVDWPTLLQQFPAGKQPPFFAELAAGISSRRAAPAPLQRSLIRELESVAQGRRRGVVDARVRAEALKVLGLAPATRLDPRQPLRELGLDSLMAVELRNGLAEALGRTLPATLLFKYPTLEALGDFVLAQVPETAAEAAAAPPAHADPDAPDLDALTDDEARELLSSEVQSLEGLLSDGH